jgi:N6-L-threonylcarbamoyladenine synthase
VAIVRDGHELLSNVVSSQIDIHKEYGGVVPEIAARSHIEVILPVLHQAFEQAGLGWDNIDGIAVTYGAGLLGSLLVGTLTARTLALIHNKPLYAINHVEGHVYANFLTDTKLDGYSLPKQQPAFPMLALVVSGKHVDLSLFTDHFTYKRLGWTRDDAIGEAFDKVAKILGLEYPGGPSIAKIAKLGMPNAYYLPKAKLAEPYNFFSTSPKRSSPD